MMDKNSEGFEELKETLKELLHSGVVTVSFIKESTGTKRDMICSLAPRFLPPQPVTPSTKNKPLRAANPDVCVVYDLEREDWRSFRYDTVELFKTIDGSFEPKELKISTVIFTPRAD